MMIRHAISLNLAARVGAGNLNQKVFAAANDVIQSDCNKAHHPNVFVAALFLASFFFKQLILILKHFFNHI